MNLKTLNVIMVLFLSLLSTACSKSVFFAANLPSYFGSQKVIADMDFGSKYNSKLNIYLPKNTKESNPVIVFFYGGKWEDGSKDDYRFVADAFTELGYIVVIPDYVKYPQVKFPEWQYDAAKALAWTHNNISKYKGNAKELFVIGHSSGAHIGALLTVDNKYLAAEGGNRNWIKAFAGIAGPYHFIPEEDDLKDMFGPQQNYKYMHVTNYIDGKQPPMLLLWGKKDTIVGEININNMLPQLQETNSLYQVKYYDDLDHISIISSLTRYKRNKSKIYEDINSYFNEITKSKKR